MELSGKDIEIIEKHLQGLLDEQEEALFEHRLSDPQFRDEVQLYQGIRNAGTGLERESFRNEMDQWDTEIKEKGGKVRTFNFKWKLAAAILFLAALAGVLYIYTQVEDHTHLYQAYYEIYPNLIDPIEKGLSDLQSSNSRLYELGQYETCSLRESADPVQSFYRSLCLLETGQVTQSVQILENLQVIEGFRFREAGEWYLALGYLRDGDETRAISILDEIRQREDHDFYGPAIALVDEIRN